MMVLLVGYSVQKEDCGLSGRVLFVGTGAPQIVQMIWIMSSLVVRLGHGSLSSVFVLHVAALGNTAGDPAISVKKLRDPGQS